MGSANVVKEQLAIEEVTKYLVEGRIKDKEELQIFKKKIAKKYKLARIPSDYEILKAIPEDKRQEINQILKKKPVRSISGVVVVAVMTRGYCPGKCIYCPNYDAPKSYTGKEPAALRARAMNYDPYLQVKNRIEQLKNSGHVVDKVELIIMGGTFLADCLCYQEWFIRRCLDAITGKNSLTIEEAQKYAEKSEIRVVGITFETRPDWCKENHVDRMLSYGATRVELGVQTLNDKVLKFVRRGHSVKDTIEATRILKDAGLKVNYHMMPGLFASFDEDIEMFKELFRNPEFRPDMLKIYPTLVLEHSGLYELWRKGKFTPLSDEEAVELIVEVKKILPRWVRVQRIQRDIPANLIVAGVRKSNLGQLVEMRLKKLGIKCKCIRCREVGHKYLKEGVLPDPKNVRLLREDYEASEGLEIFLSFEDTKNDILIGFLRLRKPSGYAHRKEVDERTMLVRELRVYGPVVALHENAKQYEWQHRGYGKALLGEAERIAREEFDAKKILITSGIGVREYYARLGYKKIGPYMGKILKE